MAGKAPPSGSLPAANRPAPRFRDFEFENSDDWDATNGVSLLGVRLPGSALSEDARSPDPEPQRVATRQVAVLEPPPPPIEAQSRAGPSGSQFGRGTNTSYAASVSLHSGNGNRLAEPYPHGRPSTGPGSLPARFQNPQYHSDRNGVPHASGSGGNNRREDRRGTPEEEEMQFQSAFNQPNIDDEYGGLDFDGYEGPEGFLRDNDADRAERNGAPADSVFQLAPRRHPGFDETFFGPRSCNVRHIAAKTSTHLSMPTDMDDPVIQMWGNPTQIAAARRDLNALSEHIRLEIELSEKRVGGKWAKIKPVPSDRRRAYLEGIAKEAALQHIFRTGPAPGTFFNAIGIFVWPILEINPQNFLGPSFEALDPIKFENRTFITFSRKRNLFRILGNHHDDVQSTTQRIYGLFCEVAAGRRRPIKTFLVTPPSINLKSSIVKIVTSHDLRGRQISFPEKVAGIQTCFSDSKPTQKFLEMWGGKREGFVKANHAYMKKVMQQGLQDVFYYRGHVRLKVHFGKLVLFSYKKTSAKSYGLLEYHDMLRHSDVAGELIRDLGEESFAHALIRECLHRDDIFQPMSPNVYSYDAHNDASQPTHRPLDQKIEPTISATFDITLSDDKGGTSDARLEIEFERVPGHYSEEVGGDSAGRLYKPAVRRWLQRPRAPNRDAKVKVAGTPVVPVPPVPHVGPVGPVGPGARTGANSAPEAPVEAKEHPLFRRPGPVDIKVQDLENEIAWQIELTTNHFVKDYDIYSSFSEFFLKLRIEDMPDEWDPVGPPAEGEPDMRKRVQRVSFVKLPGISVNSLTMKTKHQFWINETPFVFGITKYEYFPAKELTQIYPHGIATSYKGLKVKHDTRWGACFYSTDWTDTLSAQEGLGPGCVAGWDADVDAFFKSSGVAGIEDHQGRKRGKGNFEEPDPWNGDGWAEFLSRIEECARFINGVRNTLKKGKWNRVFSGTEEYDR